MRLGSVWVAWLISLILAWMLVACDPAGGSARNPTATLTPAASFTPLPSATSTHTPTQTASPIPSATPTTTPTFTPTATPTATSTRTPRPTARPATVSLSPAAQGIPGWGPRPIRVDCRLLGGSCVFILTVTVAQDYPDYYHSIELADESGNSFILGSEIVFANYVAVSHRDLRENLVKDVPYRWRVVLRRVSDHAAVARSEWSVDTYVQR